MRRQKTSFRVCSWSEFKCKQTMIKDQKHHILKPKLGWFFEELNYCPQLQDKKCPVTRAVYGRISSRHAQREGKCKCADFNTYSGSWSLSFAICWRMFCKAGLRSWHLPVLLQESCTLSILMRGAVSAVHRRCSVTQFSHSIVWRSQRRGGAAA